MGGCDCAQDGGGIGWHDQGHKEEAQSLGEEREVGTRENQPAREGVLFCVSPHPFPQHAYPFLSGGLTEFTVSHSCFLPGLCPGRRDRMQPEKGPLQRQPCPPQSPEGGGKEGYCKVSPEGGVPGAGLARPGTGTERSES